MELTDTDHKTTILILFKERKAKLEYYSKALRDVRNVITALKKNQIAILELKKKANQRTTKFKCSIDGSRKKIF